MKTTVEFPDALLRRAKVVAARRGITFKRLLSEGLEQVVRSAESGERRVLSVEESGFLEWDSQGVPVLKAGEGSLRVVTNQDIDDLREELGV